MQTGWPCGGVSQNCPATPCAVSLAPSPAFRPTLKRRAYSAKPLRGSETARRPRPRGPSARGGFAQSARWFTIGLNRMPPTRLGHPPPSGRFDKSPLSEYILSAPLFRLPHPTPAACGGSGEAAGGGVRLNSYLSKIKMPSAVITAPTEGPSPRRPERRGGRP
jgi:hypothetical protein